MTKILIFAKNIDGGTGTFINSLLSLKKIDPRLKIFTACLEKPQYRKTSHQISFYYQNKHYSDSYSFSLLTLISLIKETLWLKRLIIEYKINQIITIDAHCLILAVLVFNFCAGPKNIIVTIHNNLETVVNFKIPLFGRWITKKIISYCLNHAKLIVCVSKQLADNLYYHFNLKKKPKVIYHGINSLFKNYTLNKKNFYNQTKNKIILTISRLSPQKDISTIIFAFKLVKKKIPNIQLIIIGDGPEKIKLQSLIKRLKLKSVNFLGWVNNPQKKIKEADLFILSSHWEGFPYSIIEAMSQGLPVVATDTPFGPREILGNGKYGLLVPMKDPAAMAEAIYKLLTNKEKYYYYSQKSLERAKFFSLNKMLRAYKKVILDIMDNKNY